MPAGDNKLNLKLIPRFFIIFLVLLFFQAINYYTFSNEIAIHKRSSILTSSTSELRILYTETAYLLELIKDTTEASPVNKSMRAKMTLLAERMKNLEQRLTNLDSSLYQGHHHSEKVQEILFSKPLLLDARLNLLSNDLKAIAVEPIRTESGQLNSSIKRLENLFEQEQLEEGLSQFLDAQQESAQLNLEQLRLLNQVNFVLILMVLLILAWFVFRPLFYDIRKKNKAQQELNDQLARELEAKELATHNLLETQRKKSFILTTLAHDLKTPINANLKAMEQLEKGNFGKVSEEQKELIEEIQKSNRFIKQMIDNLLASYRYDAGEIRLNKVAFDLNLLIEEVIVYDAAFLAEEKCQQLKFIKKVEALEVYADATELKRVILNLVTNAVKFTPEGGHITVVTSKIASLSRIEVNDDGPGISAEQMEEIFLPYKTYSKQYKQIGSGLGLYLCKSVVELHNGEIEVKSNPEIGTSFIVTLPDMPSQKADKQVANPKMSSVAL